LPAHGLPPALTRNLRLPAIAAPMFLVSGPEMVIAASRSGVIGSFPAPNARTSADLEDWVSRIDAALSNDPEAAAWAVNLVVHPSNSRLPEDLACVVRHKVPLVITALGSPARVVEDIHSYGGLVFADVNSVGFARKAAAAGVDGLVLVAAGAGGHTGATAGFAFVEEVRQLGADLAYLGTSLIACAESMAMPEYKDMVVAAGAEDIVPSKGITGVTANWLKSSLIAAGYDPANMPEDKRPNFSDAQDDAKAWKNVWSAGQGVGAVRSVKPVADIIDRLVKEYDAAAARPRFAPAEGAIA
jgi:nitronate monooxygenase